jgi:hypothetical protein
VISTPTAKRHADLFLIGNDLRQVIYCCDRLLEEGLDLSGQGRALLDSAIIRYRRCFTSGVRTKLTDLVSSFTPNEQSLHDLVFTMANMHVAHSINDYEQAVTTIHIAQENGKLIRGGIGAASSLMAEFTGVQIATLKAMAIKLMDSARALGKALETELIAHVAQLSDDELLAADDPRDMAGGKRTHSRRRA